MTITPAKLPKKRKMTFGFSSLVRMQGLPILLKNLGLKVTKTREKVLQVFYENKLPLSAEYVLSKIKIDRATLYRILDIFEKSRLLRKVYLNGNSNFYEINDGHHHHIVCRNCDFIEELHNCDIKDVLQETLKISKDFSAVLEHSSEFKGLCKKCVKNSV